MRRVSTERPLRVMKVLPTLLCGGTEKQVMTLTRAIDQATFDLEFACLRRWGPYVDELAERGIPLTEYRTPSFRSPKTLAQQFQFARHLRRNDVQILHSYNFYGNVFAVPPARLAGTPVVIASIRDRGAYLSPIQRRVQRLACRLADCVLVNAVAVKDWLVADGYNPANIMVIPNGVELNRIERPADPHWLHRELGLPLSSPLIGVVSRLSRLKGLEQFIEAAGIVARQMPTARFIVVGETNPAEKSYLTELEQAAERCGVRDRIVFTGLRSDVPAVLASVAVSVMPSLNEALSNSLLESMAAGAPVVATRVGGTPEALIDGEVGLLVPPADVPELARAILTLLENRELAARLGCAARQSIAERFSIERMVTSTERLYHDLLARKTKQASWGPASWAPKREARRRLAGPGRLKAAPTEGHERSEPSEQPAALLPR